MFSGPPIPTSCIADERKDKIEIKGETKQKRQTNKTPNTPQNSRIQFKKEEIICQKIRAEEKKV